MTESEIGNQIADARRKKHMTQKELGDVLGISDKVISKWENGKAKPNIAYVENIEQVLGINIKSEYKPKNKKTLSLKVFVLILIAAVISNSLCLIFYFNSRLDRMKAYYEKKLEEASNTSYSHLDFSFIDASGKEHSLTTNIKLGDGWKVQDADGSDSTPLFDTRKIIDSDGNIIGYIGIQLLPDNDYKLPSKPETADLMELYNQVALGNDYNFDVRNSYAEIKNDVSDIIGETDVYVSGSINNDIERYDYGILAYKRYEECFLGVILFREKVGVHQKDEIAQSISIQ